MKASMLKELSLNELFIKEKDLREELFHLRRKNALKQLDDVEKINKTRKDIARVLTVINEKKRQGVTDEDEKRK
ncbi:MAG: 50S ribosomal protein L29 [Candidatus Fischerbacteria bacterium RBG_13_37_8]|uniref:Large ribosomal subunit protein uL29 n=1 Tax=Candidatus Fischerbacteria bacterium RBG_13_37_8 TaxID=1817863 RepID=A0A1F5VEA0_9BACT|nr:MAG: 50S ribosomal protein L29 [Candidatus Fischerbacteria bacterium RBG_13_37_8]